MEWVAAEITHDKKKFLFGSLEFFFKDIVADDVNTMKTFVKKICDEQTSPILEILESNYKTTMEKLDQDINDLPDL